MIPKAVPDFEGASKDLRQITEWISIGEPCCHIRFVDGEFNSMFGRIGPNADGQDHLPGSLGVELRTTLNKIASKQDAYTIVGSDWRKPAKTWDWLVEQGYNTSIRWSPPQIFVDCILGGETLSLLRELATMSTTRKLYLVANGTVLDAIGPSLNAYRVRVALPPEKLAEMRGAPRARHYGPAAYEDMPDVERYLRHTLTPGDVVLWCAGLGCKPALWRTYTGVEGTTHLDFGSFFDLAAGLESRTWMTTPPDERGWKYRNDYIPKLTGKFPW